jgi:outer membrane lipoprotein carrier protein
MRKNLLTGAGAVVLCALQLALGCAHAEQARARLNQFFTEVTSLEATFKQEVFDEKGQSMQKSSGTVRLLRPGRFRWEYIEPSPQIILADGRNLWIYDIELEQATVKPLREALGAAPIMLLSEKRPLEEDFIINKFTQGENLDWVEAVPKKPDMEFQRIEFGLKGKEVRQLVLHDQFGQKTVIQFDNMKTNLNMEPYEFRLELPPGVDVIGVAQ